MFSNEHGLVREIELAYIKCRFIKTHDGNYLFCIYTDNGLQYSEEVDRFLTDKELYEGVEQWLNLQKQT